MEEKIRERFVRWKRQCADVPEMAAQLAQMEGDEAAVTDAFYRDLAFGTGGLRGVLGAGTNRMNLFTVAKASQGLARYVLEHYPEGERRIAISRDSRIHSDLFARTAAEVFAGNGIEVQIYREIMPTPCLSYAVRALHCSAGVMVTASHNPAKYNGYKVYGPDGCQITACAAAQILADIESVDVFDDVLREDFDAAMAEGRIAWIGEEVYTAFIGEVLHQSVLGDDPADKEMAIVYSPLNGTGRGPVQRALHEAGFSNITVVREQEEPDGNFPTCPYPNPEIREAMELGIQYAQRLQADLLMATDPDCDRCGIAVRTAEGEYQLLTGNETGMLLLDYICQRRIALGTMPQDPVMVKTIVTSDLAERIAAHYGVRTKNVLTGFKYIGEQIGLLEREGHASSYIFGMEESYGYLTGTYVRDKDAVDASLMIAQMAAWYRAQGVTLSARLQELYAQYGYCLNTLHSFTFEGAAGAERMAGIMRVLHGGLSSIGGRQVRQTLDYSRGLDGLPKSDVLRFLLEGNCSVTVRPSGTEPKVKLYLSVSAPDREAAEALERQMSEEMEARMR